MKQRILLTYLLLLMLIPAMTLAVSAQAREPAAQDPKSAAQDQENAAQDPKSTAEKNSIETQKEKSNGILNLKPDKTPEIPDSDSISFLKSLMALCFVLGLIFLAAYFFKRITGMKGTGFRTNRVPISMVGNFPLGDKKYLALMEIQDKHYFIGITQSSINLLSEVELDPEKMSQDSGPQDFENIFQKARLLLQRGPGAVGSTGTPGKK